MAKSITILGWVVLTLFAAIALAFAMFVAVNIADEPLRRDVRNAIDWQVPDGAQAGNGFLLMLGMNAPGHADALEAGRAVALNEWARYAKGDRTAPEFRLETPELAQWHESACDYAREKSCLDFYLAHRSRVATALAENAFLVRRFADIARAPHFIEVLPPSPYAMFPPWEHLAAASEMMRAQAVFDILDGRPTSGMKRLIGNAHFSRRLLAQTSTLLGRMMAVATFERDLRIICDLVYRYPELALRFEQELLTVAAPLIGPEFSMRKVLEREKALGLHMLKELRRDQVASAVSPHGRWAEAWVALTYLPNATANLLGQWYDRVIALADVPAHQLDEAEHARLQSWLDLLGWRLWGGLYFENPAGKALVRSNDASYTQYLERQHDLDGYLRLASLQIKLLADRVPASRVARVIESLAPKFRHPYTGKPMDWHPGAGTLVFEGRQPSNSNFERNRLFRVQVL